MKRWLDTVGCRIGLRLAGLAGLYLAWQVGDDLYARIHSHPSAPATLASARSFSFWPWWGAYCFA